MKKKMRFKSRREDKRQPWAPVKMKMYSIPQILPPELSKKERLTILRNIGTKARTDFDKKYPTIEKWFREYDALYILSFCAYYFTSHPEGIDPEANGRLDFYHHYLEVMQAFALYQERNHDAKPLLQEAEKLQKEMQEIGDLMMMRLVNIPPHITSDEEIKAYRLRTEMMAHTTAVRNWAYFHQMKRITFDLAKLIGPDFQAVYKMHPKSLLELLWKLTEERNDLLNDHRQKVRNCLREPNYKTIIAAFNRTFPEKGKIEGDEVELAWRRAGRNINNFRGMLLCYSDLDLKNIYSFTLEYAQSLLREEIDATILREVFLQLSLQFGQLKDLDKEHIILNNPVLRKPFIKLDSDTFYSAIWGIMPHLLLDILESFIWQDDKLREKYTNLKSKYLEDEIETLFTRGFPNATIYRGSLWQDPTIKKDFENDLLVLIDSFALVVEAKSGSISDPAKRGAPDRLFETLRKLIEDPSEQALRFIAFLQDNKGQHSFPTKRGIINTVDNSKIKYYIPLGITLSHLGTIGSNLKKLIEARVVEKNLEELAPSINFTDLESIFELLTLEAEKIHYLARRREFEAHMDYEGDELDLLGFYLDNGFNIGEVEYSSEMAMNIILKSKELDPYFVGSNEGVAIEKPRLAMSEWWRDLLTVISLKRTEGWIETSFVLLNTTKEDQEKFETELDALIANIRQGKIEKPHNWVIFVSGPERRRYVIAGYPYTKIDKELRNGIMSGILDDEQAKKARGVVIIGRNIESHDYPYSVIARRLSTNLFDTLTL